MTQRIQKAIDIFLDALNNGTLVKGTCCACAVGNLVAHGLGGTIYNNEGDYIANVSNEDWMFAFVTSFDGQALHPERFKEPAVVKCVEATDFTLSELIEIEHAFETNAHIHYTDYHEYGAQQIRNDQIRGLEAVVKVMLEFDNAEEEVERVFTSKAELISV